MRRNGFLAALAVMAACLIGAATASASSTVCASHCPYTTIQAALNAAAPGATVSVAAGSYTENLTISKPVTLSGYGARTIIYPSVSKPVCSGGSLCGGTASNIILVQADNVTITKLMLEGDNPSLTSGVVVGGKDIDARNGIITNHLLGKPFNNLLVSKVKVADVYLRGIYASSEGSFVFEKNTIENVQAEEASIAMFNFGGTGVMSHNTVIAANDAISANWSRGTSFVGNRISQSGSGVHTDNNGGFGGNADVIEGNKVTACKSGGYGIFVFAPYLDATVASNKVAGCAVGLGAFGSQATGAGPTFSNNRVDGSGATTTDPNGTYGAYITTDLLGFGFGDVNVTLSHNSFEHSGTGVFVTQTSPSPEQPAGGQATVGGENNTIHPNAVGAVGGPGTVFEAKNDWWGCKTGPNSSTKCDTATGTTNYTPWLISKP